MNNILHQGRAEGVIEGAKHPGLQNSEVCDRPLRLRYYSLLFYCTETYFLSGVPNLNSDHTPNS